MKVLIWRGREVEGNLAEQMSCWIEAEASMQRKVFRQEMSGIVADG